MPERESWRPDVVYEGNVPDAKKLALREKLAVTFHGKRPEQVSARDWQLIKREEAEKTSQERAAIRVANTITNETRQQYGLASFDIPEQNFLVLPDRAYTKGAGDIMDEQLEVATSDPEHQRVYLREKIARLFPIHALQTILHEMAHQKGVVVFEVPRKPVEQDEQRKQAIARREGFTAYSHSETLAKDDEHEHFLGLDEAIIENYMIRRTPRLLKAPEFAHERAWLMSEEAQRMKATIAKREKIPIHEIAWVNPDGAWRAYDYRPHREVLTYCAEEIAQTFPKEFSSAEEVIDRFEEGAFVRRRLLSLGRYMEKTFGKGAFRLLGDMGDGTDEEEEDKKKKPSRVLDELRHARRAALR